MISHYQNPNSRLFRSGGVLALALVVAACQQQEAPAPQAASRAAASGAAEPRVAEPAPKVVDRALAEITALDSAQVARFDRDEVERIEAGMTCSIDSINTVAVGSAPVPSGSDLRVSGWIAVGEAAPERVLAIFKGEQAFAMVAQLRQDRPDIAEKANVPKVADVVAQSVAAEIPKGTYKVYFARKDASGWAKCVANSDVVIQ